MSLSDNTIYDGTKEKAKLFRDEINKLYTPTYTSIGDILESKVGKTWKDIRKDLPDWGFKSKTGSSAYSPGSNNNFEYNPSNFEQDAFSPRFDALSSSASSTVGPQVPVCNDTPSEDHEKEICKQISVPIPKIREILTEVFRLETEESVAELIAYLIEACGLIETGTGPKKNHPRKLSAELKSSFHEFTGSMSGYTKYISTFPSVDFTKIILDAIPENEDTNVVGRTKVVKLMNAFRILLQIRENIVAHYWEPQESNLCGQHAGNHILQEGKLIFLKHYENTANGLLIDKTTRLPLMDGDERDALHPDIQINLAHYFSEASVLRFGLPKGENLEPYIARNDGFFGFEALGLLLTKLLKFRKIMGATPQTKYDTLLKRHAFINSPEQLNVRHFNFYLGNLFNVDQIHYTATIPTSSGPDSHSRQDRFQYLDSMHTSKPKQEGLYIPNNFANSFFIFYTSASYKSFSVRIKPLDIIAPSPEPHPIPTCEIEEGFIMAENADPSRKYVVVEVNKEKYEDDPRREITGGPLCGILKLIKIEEGGSPATPPFEMIDVQSTLYQRTYSLAKETSKVNDPLQLLLVQNKEERNSKPLFFQFSNNSIPRILEYLLSEEDETQKNLVGEIQTLGFSKAKSIECVFIHHCKTLKDIIDKLIVGTSRPKKLIVAALNDKGKSEKEIINLFLDYLKVSLVRKVVNGKIEFLGDLQFDQYFLEPVFKNCLNGTNEDQIFSDEESNKLYQEIYFKNPQGNPKTQLQLDEFYQGDIDDFKKLYVRFYNKSKKLMTTWPKYLNERTKVINETHDPLFKGMNKTLESEFESAELKKTNAMSKPATLSLEEQGSGASSSGLTAKTPPRNSLRKPSATEVPESTQTAENMFASLSLEQKKQFLKYMRNLGKKGGARSTRRNRNRKSRKHSHPSFSVSTRRNRNKKTRRHFRH